LKNEETAAAAAVMSQAVGKPVRLQLMRWDEHGYDFFDAAQLNDIRAGVDASGKIVAFDVTRYTIPYGTSVPTVEQLLGAPISSTDQATISPSGISGAQYNIPNMRQTAISLPPINAGFVKVGPVRAPQDFGLGFATQQMFDELAHAANMDPVAFHRLNISTSDTARWLAVLDAVTDAANWQPKVAASKLSTGNIVTGRGLALGVRGFTPGLGAAAADVEVNKTTGKVTVKHVYTAQDYGIAIGPDLVTSQAMGMTMHAASRVLMEQARFNGKNVTSLDWIGYPILRFKDHPNHTHVVITQPFDTPPNPSSEELMPPIAAAIANAFFDATGVRMRTAPLSPERVRAALKAAGGA
jgi:CO/xanthine dehydrogenase Mo-binding subunit